MRPLFYATYDSIPYSFRKNNTVLFSQTAYMQMSVWTDILHSLP
jgi:hypothetical protein